MPPPPEHQEEKREYRGFPFIFPCFQGCHKILWFSCSRGIFPLILSFSLHIPMVWLDRSRKSSQFQAALKGFHLKVSHWGSQFLLHSLVHCWVSSSPDLKGRHRFRCIIINMLFCINNIRHIYYSMYELCCSKWANHLAHYDFVPQKVIVQ